MSFLSGMKDWWDGRRAIGDGIGNWWNGYRMVRVAVIGGGASGKTVFLTALANHLQDHNSNEFPLGFEVVWDKSKNQEEKLYGFDRFPYGVAHDELASGGWPDKTRSESLLAMRLNLKYPDGRQEPVQLELLDIPGERVADFVMLDRTFKEWCLWMQQTLAGPDGSNAAYRKYIDKLKDARHTELEILDAYRDYLKEEFENFSLFITPSTVRLAVADDERKTKDPAAFRSAISSVPIGFVSKDGTRCEFVPLPDTYFADQAWHEVIERFSKAFDKYKATVLLPTKEWLEGDWHTTGAKKLFYLVDTLHLLQEGPKAWHAQRDCGEAIIGMLCPRKPYAALQRGLEWLKGALWKTRIDTVYAVATKSDRVCSDQRDNLKSLVKELLGKALKNLAEGITTDALSCSAVCATQEVLINGERGLQGWILERESARQSGAHSPWIPSNVPPAPPHTNNEWIARQKSGEFNYPDVFPGFAFSAGREHPPRHLGLNTLVKEMLAE